MCVGVAACVRDRGWENVHIIVRKFLRPDLGGQTLKLFVIQARLESVLRGPISVRDPSVYVSRSTTNLNILAGFDRHVLRNTQFVSFFAPSLCVNGLSVGAFTTNNVMVGCFISEDFVDYKPPSGLNTFLEKYPTYAQLIGMLQHVDGKYEKWRTERRLPPIQHGELLHLWMGATMPELGGQGIAAQLIEFTTQVAKKRGFSGCVAEATGYYSQRLCERLGFTEVVHQTYRDWVYPGDNTQPFHTMPPPHEKVTFVVKMFV